MTGFTLPIVPVAANGFTAWLAEDHSIPVVAISWSWLGGAALDANGAEGTISLAASLLTEGAGELRAAAFTDVLRDNAISLGFSAGRDDMDGGLRALTDALPEAVRLARLAMTAPRLDPDAIERVRARALLSVRQGLETPRGQAGRAFWSATFPDHPAGRPSSGTPESLAAITRDGLAAALSRQLRRDGLQIAAAGDITPAQLAALLPVLFAELPAGAPPAAPKLPAPTRFGQKIVPVTAPQSQAIFGQPGLSVQDPSWETAQVVLRILGGGGFSSRLMEAVRVQRGLAYGIGVGLDTLFGEAMIVGSVATENARMAETLMVTRDEWSRMAEAGPTAEELADAVAFLTGNQPLQFTDTRRIAGTLLALQRNARPLDWLAKRPERLAAITPTAATATARRLLQPDAISVVVAGQPVGL